MDLGLILRLELDSKYMCSNSSSRASYHLGSNSLFSSFYSSIRCSNSSSISSKYSKVSSKYRKGSSIVVSGTTLASW